MTTTEITAYFRASKTCLHNNLKFDALVCVKLLCKMAELGLIGQRIITKRQRTTKLKGKACPSLTRVYEYFSEQLIYLLRHFFVRFGEMRRIMIKDIKFSLILQGNMSLFRDTYTICFRKASSQKSGPLLSLQGCQHLTCNHFWKINQ